MSEPKLEDLIKAAVEAFNRLTPEQMEKILQKQRESLARSGMRGDMTDEEWKRWS